MGLLDQSIRKDCPSPWDAVNLLPSAVLFQIPAEIARMLPLDLWEGTH